MFTQPHPNTRAGRDLESYASFTLYFVLDLSQPPLCLDEAM